MFANIIKEYGYTINDIAALLHNARTGKRGVSYKAAYETINGNPKLSKVKDLANALGIAPSELLAISEQQQPKQNDLHTITCPNCGKHLHIEINTTIENITLYE